MYWAFLLSLGIATIQTTVSLGRFKRLMNFVKLVLALTELYFIGFIPLHVNKLKMVVLSRHNYPTPMQLLDCSKLCEGHVLIQFVNDYFVIITASQLILA
jgi:hypothetical protein